MGFCQYSRHLATFIIAHRKRDTEKERANAYKEHIGTISAMFDFRKAHMSKPSFFLFCYEADSGMGMGLSRNSGTFKIYHVI